MGRGMTRRRWPESKLLTILGGHRSGLVRLANRAPPHSRNDASPSPCSSSASASTQSITRLELENVGSSASLRDSRNSAGERLWPGHALSSSTPSWLMASRCSLEISVGLAYASDTGDI